MLKSPAQHLHVNNEVQYLCWQQPVDTCSLKECCTQPVSGSWTVFDELTMLNITMIVPVLLPLSFRRNRGVGTKHNPCIYICVCSCIPESVSAFLEKFRWAIGNPDGQVQATCVFSL